MATLALRLVVAAAILATTASAYPAAPPKNRSSSCYPRLFSFGDSLIDTGNFIHYSKAPGSVSRPPYGRTFFGRPTGRWSDGRLIVDFIGTGEAGVPVLAGVPAGQVAGDEGGLPVRRQLRGGERHGAEPAALPEEAPGRQRHHPLLPGHPDRLVQEGARRHRPHRQGAEGGDGQVAVPRRRDRRQRLQPPLLPEQDARLGQAPRAQGHQIHCHVHRGSDRAGSQDHLRAGRVPARLRAAVPLLLPRRRPRRLRRRRLPQVAQRPHRLPQRHAEGQDPRPPPRPPRRVHHLRRLLRRDHQHHHHAGAERVRPGEGALRVLRRRRAVQRQPRHQVPGSGGGAVPGPVQVRVLGRPAHDGGGVQDHGARHARRPLRQAADHGQMQPKILEKFCSADTFAWFFSVRAFRFNVNNCCESIDPMLHAE